MLRARELRARPGHQRDRRPVHGDVLVAATPLEIETPHGPARVKLEPAPRPSAALLLGHGAGGGTDAPDLKEATAAAREAGITVALVDQPYRVAGRRSPAPAHQLDTAWLAVVAALRAGDLGDLPLIFGGRSSGARVACRTAADGKAAAVLCLAFPEHPPGKPEKSRQDELDAVAVPTLVVQGESDPFGMPKATKTAQVVTVPGNHSLKKDLPAVRAAVADWLATL